MAKPIALGFLLFLFLPLSGLCLDIHITSDARLGAVSGTNALTSEEHAEQFSLQMDSSSQVNENLNLSSETDLRRFSSDEPDWEGLKTDSELLLFYQLGTVVVLFFLPEKITKWDEEKKRSDPFENWDDNVKNLRRDEDEWAVNYIGHPYFGATYYVRARSRGYNRSKSFWYTAAMSTVYEYGVEAVFEPVSVQDLVVTPVGGAIVGEYFIYSRQKILKRITRTGKQSTWDNVALFLTDPLAIINKKVMGLFGKPYHASLMIHSDSLLSQLPNGFVGRRPMYDSDYVGIQLNLLW